MNNRKRLLVGLTLLVVAFLCTLQEGAVGRVLVQFFGYLFGQTGTGVVAVLMFTAGVVLVVPPGTIGKFFRWTTHSTSTRVERVVQEMDEDMIAARIERAVMKALKEQARAKSDVVSGEILVPADRMRLDDVRSALKQLGYVKTEYEPLVRAMDPRAPFEGLVKSALKSLQARN